jgi:hypothetical protein
VNRRAVIVGDIRQSAASQELDGQVLCGSVCFQRQTGRLRGCTVAGGIERPPPTYSFIVKQVDEADTQRLRNALDGATGVTLQKPLALAMSNAERILLVGVGWASRRPAVAGLLNSLQSNEYVGHADLGWKTNPAST